MSLPFFEYQGNDLLRVKGVVILDTGHHLTYISTYETALQRRQGTFTRLDNWFYPRTQTTSGTRWKKHQQPAQFHLKSQGHSLRSPVIPTLYI
jgi:hypothetical protein